MSSLLKTKSFLQTMSALSSEPLVLSFSFGLNAKLILHGFENLSFEIKAWFDSF
jgi:hypothetical protein